LKTFSKKLYEGMFLVDSALAASDWDSIIATIRTILEKGKAEVISIRKWTETKLAYEINHKSRGTYILCYFRVEGPKVSNIEREIRLSEKIMRALILNADHMTQEDMEKDTPAKLAEKRLQESSVEPTTPIADDVEEDVVNEEVVVDAIEAEIDDEESKK
jgi:small subunit ribosomal protein S6